MDIMNVDPPEYGNISRPWTSIWVYDVVYCIFNIHMGVSENSVLLNPMVNDHYPY